MNNIPRWPYQHLSRPANHVQLLLNESVKVSPAPGQDPSLLNRFCNFAASAFVTPVKVTIPILAYGYFLRIDITASIMVNDLPDPGAAITILFALAFSITGLCSSVGVPFQPHYFVLIIINFDKSAFLVYCWFYWKSLFFLFYAIRLFVKRVTME